MMAAAMPGGEVKPMVSACHARRDRSLPSWLPFQRCVLCRIFAKTSFISRHLPGAGKLGRRVWRPGTVLECQSRPGARPPAIGHPTMSAFPNIFATPFPQQIPVQIQVEANGRKSGESPPAPLSRFAITIRYHAAFFAAPPWRDHHTMSEDRKRQV